VELFQMTTITSSRTSSTTSFRQEASTGSQQSGHSADRALRMPDDPAQPRARSGRGRRLRWTVVTSSIGTERSETRRIGGPLRLRSSQYIPATSSRFNRHAPELSASQGNDRVEQRSRAGLRSRGGREDNSTSTGGHRG
jgi:hypothetical protein